MKVKGFKLNSILWDSLRGCQKEGIETGFTYIKSQTPEKSCLISLPTGAGKSGIISVIAHKATQQKTLVLCHRRAVCNQLYRELNGRFFQKIASETTETNISSKAVLNGITSLDENGIYLTTFQKLSTLSATELETLRENIDLLIIDEGHSEPSPEWRKLARHMDTHKIVVTATPYRNDLFQFDIDSRYSYIYTFAQALDDEILEEPRFVTINQNNLVASIREFLEKNPGTKCIIKCKTLEDINSYYTQLNQEFRVLAVHEQLTNDVRDNVSSRVPNDLADTDYQVIIHQRKLDEGVDIPQAKLLVLTYPVSSGRELVQTIGRVVRLYEGIQPEVIEFESDQNAYLWNNYRTFDESLDNTYRRKVFLESLDTSTLLEKYLSAFPDSSYFNRVFKSKLDLNNFNPERSLVIPRASVRFYARKRDFSASNLFDDLYWVFTNEGELTKKFPLENGLHVLVSISFNSSKFLSDTLFFEPSLNITIFKDMDEILAVFDNRNRKFNQHRDLKHHFGSAISQEKLLKVAAQGASSVTKEASTKSISTAKRRPKSISIKAPNLDDVAITQANAAYRLSTLKLDNFDDRDKKQGSFYVGIGAGRIADEKNKDFSLQELNSWLEDIRELFISEENHSSRLIESYAKPVDYEPTGTPHLIIFDFSMDEEIDSEIHIKCNEISSILDNSFLSYEYDNGFRLVDGSDDFNCSVDINNDDGLVCTFHTDHPIKYAFSREAIEHEEYEGDISEILTARLHKILYSDGSCFSGGKFYQYTLPTEAGFSIEGTQVAEALVSLSALTAPEMSEKDEDHVSNDEFSQNSIFYLIDQLKNYSDSSLPYSSFGPFARYIPEADIVFCTDMGPEPADFIISSTEKLVFVHVKCGSSQNPQSAAGSIYEVGSQAIKNIEYITTHDEELAWGNSTYLTNPWPKGSADNTLNERIRLLHGSRFENPQDSVDLRQEQLQEMSRVISERRKSPTVQKEIWLVIGNGFSREHFSREMLRGRRARPASLQSYQLIQSWMATAYDHDVELKIFTSV